MINKPLFLSLSFASAFSPLSAQEAQQQTPEQRLLALENRVSFLEQQLAKLQQKQPSVVPSKPDKKLPEGNSPLFHDGFEQGTSKWDITQKSVLAPYLQGASERNRKSLSLSSKYKISSPWRTAKSATLQGKTFKALEGKRFLTSMATSEDYTKQESQITMSSGIINDWRAIRYVVQKSPISLNGLKLPIATFKAHWHQPIDPYKKAYKNVAFQAGYIVEGNTLGDFQPLMTLNQSTAQGWEEFEIDLSSVPKDKKIQLVFTSFMVDSRKVTSSGLQLDDVKVLDDGQ